MSSDNPSADTSIRDQAAYWVARLNDTDLGEAERAELHRWLLADPRHSGEFRKHNVVLRLAHEFSAEIQARLTTFVPAGAAAPKAPTQRRWMWPSAFAASLLVALAIGGWVYFDRPQLPSQSYATRTGEMRTVLFGEGSVAYLNTRTRIKWMGGVHERRVALLEGEALFDVARDPARPFRVLLDGSEIRVLGTRFNVYRKKDGETIVTVLEGVVEVHERGPASGRPAWQRRLAANQQLVYRPVGVVQDVRETRHAARAVKWRDGVMEIYDEPLPEVLEELTRYTDQRIVIRDPDLNQIRVGGVISVRDVRVALARLQKLAPVAVTEENHDTFTLDLRNDTRD